jgi:hypothetical protein
MPKYGVGAGYPGSSRHEFGFMLHIDTRVRRQVTARQPPGVAYITTFKHCTRVAYKGTSYRLANGNEELMH